MIMHLHHEKNCMDPGGGGGGGVEHCHVYGICANYNHQSNYKMEGRLGRWEANPVQMIVTSLGLFATHITELELILGSGCVF